MSAECVTHRSEPFLHPARVPIVAVSSSRPARSSWRVSRSNFGRSGWSGGRKASLRCRIGGFSLRGVVDALDLARPQVELDAPQQGRVRVGLEVGVDEIRDLARVPVQLDQVGPLDLTEVGAGAALVDAEQRVERFEGTAMDVEGIRQELAHGRASAGVVNGLGIAGPEESVVGQSAGVGVAAEGRTDVPLEADREGRDRRTSPESPEGQVNEQVFGVARAIACQSSVPVTRLIRANARLSEPNRVSMVEIEFGDGLTDDSELSASPQAADAVHIELAVITDDRDPFDEGLSDDQPVKRVTMVHGQDGLSVGIFQGDRQDRGFQIGQGLGHPRAVWLGKGQLPDSDLDGRLPDGGRADE